MEKLQAAIEKAREQRQTQVRQAVRREKAIDPEPGLWENLPQMAPNTARLSKNRVSLDGRSNEAGHYDKLRTKVIQLCSDNNWRRVLITSPTKSCGKTTTCANLSASFARQTDRRIMVVDMDMRRPELGPIFGIKQEFGFSDVLTGEKPIEAVAQRLGPNVAIAPNAAPHPNPSQLVLQDRTPEILAEIEDQFATDFLFIDSPPVFTADDTIGILKFVDCAIIVVGAESTTSAEIDMCEREVASQTNVLGVVLNKCVYMDAAHGYEYYK